MPILIGIIQSMIVPELPSDIKSMIYKVNKDRETVEYERNKKRHEEFVARLTEVFEYDEICEWGVFHWDYHENHIRRLLWADERREKDRMVLLFSILYSDRFDMNAGKITYRMFDDDGENVYGARDGENVSVRCRYRKIK